MTFGGLFNRYIIISLLIQRTYSHGVPIHSTYQFTQRTNSFNGLIHSP